VRFFTLSQILGAFMKKTKQIITSLVLALIMVFSLAALTGCNGYVNGGNPALINFNVDFIRYVAADLEGASSVGVLTTNQLAGTALSARQGRNSWLVRQGSPLDTVNFTVANEETVTFVNADGNEVTKTQISQEEIPAQVNRSIVARGFTFIQFVPAVEASGVYTYGNYEVFINLRSETDGIEFDRGPFYTDTFSTSFVIYNETGKIFPIPQEVRIEEVDEKGGLIWQPHASGTRPFTWEINEEGNLELIQLVGSATMLVHGAFEDRYGNIFIEMDGVPYQANNIWFWQRQSTTQFHRAINEYGESIAVRVQLESAVTHFDMSNLTYVDMVSADGFVSLTNETLHIANETNILRNQGSGFWQRVEVLHTIRDGYVYQIQSPAEFVSARHAVRYHFATGERWGFSPPNLFHYFEIPSIDIFTHRSAWISIDKVLLWNPNASTFMAVSNFWQHCFCAGQISNCPIYKGGLVYSEFIAPQGLEIVAWNSNAMDLAQLLFVVNHPIHGTQNYHIALNQYGVPYLAQGLFIPPTDGTVILQPLR